ncbi:uncharacterized protein J4E78_001721 [Alternaria triticimaculans]|uniref:uncharacterized protein n=1 Tax=Alternaria triticimaculans TaxID=297637 RepID=UPI0020C5420B|nr:uncharacterized protein J4E78_001721 [Alternaria triticimaculans]KAI4667902.1 hypothetical protein J4E78_001721 [Alternaria triticimaculans]
MAATFARHHNFDQVPTYNHGNAIANQQPPYDAYAASHHHVAARHSNMAAYCEPTTGNPQHAASMNDHGQQHDHSYSPDDTSGKRESFQHGLAGQHHDYRIHSPTSEASYIGIQHNSAQAPLDNDASDRQFAMLPPSNSIHPSWQSLHDYAQSHAAENGYALSINTTAKNRSRIKLACVCYGQPKNTHKLTAETRVRKNRVSYKTGCKMWIEGKKQDDGTWLLRVGEPQHNHPGRESAGWAVQRKRTWGVVGGRIGVGGVTAKEELAKSSLTQNQETLEDVDAEADGDEDIPSASTQAPKKPQHSLERGGLVWRIVEQEMLRKGEPNQGRDRGVGRTVEVLQARLPGIHIFKRDVYNIRAQIKRARKAAGQQVGDGLNSSDDEAEADAEVDIHDTAQLSADTSTNHPTQRPAPHPQNTYQHPTSHTLKPPAPFPLVRKDSRIDPLLDSRGPPPPNPPEAVDIEVDQLRRENAELRRMLTERTKQVKEKTTELAERAKEIKDKTTEMAALKSQVELLSNMMMTSGRGLIGG